MTQQIQTTSRRPGWSDLRTPAGRAAALSAAVLAAGTALLLATRGWGAPALPPHSPAAARIVVWCALVPAFVASEVLDLHWEVRGETHTFSVSEVPLLLGIALAPPWVVILARTLGGTLHQAVRRRQRGVKLAFNSANFLLDAAVSVSLVRLLVGGRSLTDWSAWPGAALGVCAGGLVSVGCISLVIHWHGGYRPSASIAAASLASTLLNVSIGLVAVVLLELDAPALGMLCLVLLAVVAAYRSFARLRTRYSHLETVYDFTRDLAGTADADGVIRDTLAGVRSALYARSCRLLFFDAGDVALAGGWRAEEGVAEVVAVGAPAPHLATLTGTLRGAALLDRAHGVAAEVAVLDELGADQLVVAALPMDDRVTGALVVADRLGNVAGFGDDDRRLMETLANHALVALRNSRLVDELRMEAQRRSYEARHDPLTGLPNRAAFLDATATAVAAGPAAVMLMDLDRFKEVNDTLGHHTGDALLQQVARRLRDVLADGSMAARLGGDEFALLLRHCSGAEQARAKADEVVEALRRPFEVQYMRIEVGASLGISLAPLHGGDASTLLQRADVAMYRSKETRSGPVVYTSEQDIYSPRRLALATQLREAIDSGELQVHFQPKVDARTGTVTGAEALVRWQHPDFGLLPPDEFIPVAEQTGLISHLTAFVLEQSAARCAAWRAAGHDVTVAVNLAVRSLLDVDLTTVLRALLAEVGIPPDALVLEITESSVMLDPERAQLELFRLAEMGVGLSIDDFGTGYSSLAYLQRLPVHEVKIDKSFVLGMSTSTGDAAIVRSIVELGHNLGLKVVAEGVEDVPTWLALRALSCDTIQGWCVSRAVPAEQLTALLRDGLDPSLLAPLSAAA